MKRSIFAVTLIALTSLSIAQSRNSFQPATSFNGVVITGLTSTSWKLELSAAPTVVYLGQTYNVTDVFGLWLLDDNGDLGGSGSNFSQWDYHDNYAGAGGIVGFKTNPNTGVTPGNSTTFNFSSLNGVPEGTGIHVRFAQNLPGGGNTIYLQSPGAVPEPATIAAIGLGIASLLRRKRK